MTQTDQLIEKLQYDLSRKAYSFAEYISHASPYIRAGQEELWQTVLEVRGEERRHARMLEQLIRDLGGVPRPRLFDESATDLNYLRLDHLVERLLKHKEASVAQWEERIQETNHFPWVRAVLLEILRDEKRQVERLRAALTAARRAPIPEPALTEAEDPPPIAPPPNI